MPPTDDEYFATAMRALVALEADLDRALKQPEARREDTREIAQQIRELIGRARKVLGDHGITPLFQRSEAAMRRTIDSLGTSAWEDPEMEGGKAVAHYLRTITDLRAEIERLRSDEWLSIAAERIAGSANPYDWQANLAILRKHRDGKA
jgi:hypothetical protein